MIKTAIVGATGFTGSELIRILLQHPQFEITYITSESHKGSSYSLIHPAFKGRFEQKLLSVEDLSKHEVDLIFLALPHGVSMHYVQKFSQWKAKIVDLSGDYRLDSPTTYESWYNKAHSFPEAFDYAVYGLPELNRSLIQKADLVANPGCYPTAAILSLLPLADKGLLSNSNVFIDAKSGTTGAGIKPSDGNLFSNVNENFKAYKIAQHRHTIEIEQLLLGVHSTNSIQFTPHLLPVDRGILSTAYVHLGEVDQSTIDTIYESFYKDHPFVNIVDEAPSIKDVRGSNYCTICPIYDERTQNLIVVSVIDNLMKGAAGQAVQNANLMFELEETCGLHLLALRP